MDYVITQGPKPALKLIREIADIVGPPTEDETGEQSEEKADRAKEILRERLSEMSYEEVMIIHASLASLYGISRFFLNILTEHLQSLGNTIEDLWEEN